MKFTNSHEWIKIEGDIGTVGITTHAQKELGEIVFIELPKIGAVVKAGEEIAVLESTKAAADIYTPVSGTITELNEQAKFHINTSPETTGWLYKIHLSDLSELSSLLTPDQYLSTVIV